MQLVLFQIMVRPQVLLILLLPVIRDACYCLGQISQIVVFNSEWEIVHLLNEEDVNVRKRIEDGMLVVSMAIEHGFPSFILGIFILDCLNLKIVQFS